MTDLIEPFQVVPDFEPELRQLGIACAQDAFATPAARVWRSIAERENATIDLPSGRRLHLKRDKRRLSPELSAAGEVRGIEAVAGCGLPTAKLVAHGALADGRTFVITEDLAGYQPADVALRTGVSFDQISLPLAAVAGRLHQHRLFHRDLYLCHFMVKVEQAEAGLSVDVRLIDLARVLVRPFWAVRWQIKDLAQFVYSTRAHSVSRDQLDEFLEQYGWAFDKRISGISRRLIESKANRIARHDAALHRNRPERDVSLPP